MQNRRNESFKLFGIAMDALAISLTYLALLKAREALPAMWSFDLFPNQEVLRQVPIQTHVELLPLVVSSWLVSLIYFRTYDNLHRVGFNSLLVQILKASLAGQGLALLVLFATQHTDELSRTLFFGFPAVSFATLLITRGVLARWVQARFRKGIGARNVLIVGSAGEALPLINTLERNPHWGIRVLGVVHTNDNTHDEISEVHYKVMGRLDDLPVLLEQHPIDQVYMTGRPWDVRTLREIADCCEELGVEFSIDANFLGLRVAQALLGDFEGNTVLSFSTTPANPGAMAIKRLMDVVLSGLALLALSPALLFTAIAVKVDDPGGPVFFGQVRSGLYGRTFKMWKFRSMVSNAEALREQLEAANEMDGPVFKISRDPRITRVGHIIRKTSIDELPQFWNVLMGDMSLVGPRPPIPAEVVEYERWQRRRLSMKPGITCIWQVSGRNDIDFRTWMKLDLQYIDNWSLLLDIKLLAQTLPAVIRGTGK